MERVDTTFESDVAVDERFDGVGKGEEAGGVSSDGVGMGDMTVAGAERFAGASMGETGGPDSRKVELVNSGN